MPLDSAQFISELSIDDPPGTDPLNQGDDQIRTTKRATQQSFPNVDAAVPQTAAQMAQMAIKNEANTFTQINTWNVAGQRFTDLNVLKSDASDPAGFHYEDEFAQRRWSLNMGSVAAGRDFQLRRRDAAGTLLEDSMTIRASTGNVVWGAGALQFAPDGTAAVPAYSFSDQSNTGMFRVTDNQIGFATQGTQRLHVKNNGLETIVGEVGAPSYSFIGDNDTGIFNVQPNILKFATGGVERMSIDSVGMVALARVSFQNTSDTSGFRLRYMTQAGVIRFQWIFEASSTSTPFDLRLNRHSAAGTFLGIPIAFDPDNGVITMDELPTTNPGGTGRLWRNPTASGFVAIT